MYTFDVKWYSYIVFFVFFLPISSGVQFFLPSKHRASVANTNTGADTFNL